MQRGKDLPRLPETAWATLITGEIRSTQPVEARGRTGAECADARGHMTRRPPTGSFAPVR